MAQIDSKDFPKTATLQKMGANPKWLYFCSVIGTPRVRDV